MGSSAQSTCPLKRGRTFWFHPVSPAGLCTLFITNVQRHFPLTSRSNNMASSNSYITSSWLKRWNLTYNTPYSFIDTFIQFITAVPSSIDCESSYFISLFFFSRAFISNILCRISIRIRMEWVCTRKSRNELKLQTRVDRDFYLHLNVSSLINTLKFYSISAF